MKIPWEIRKLVSNLVIDEAHLFCTPSQVPVLLGTCPKYVIGCSATLDRADGMEDMIYSILGNEKLEVKNDKRFTVYKLNTGIQVEIQKNKQGTTNFSRLSMDLAFHPKRNNMIIDVIQTNKQNKFMILTWAKAHVDYLTDALKKKGESVDKLSGTKSTYVDSRILVGTYSKISTGFDCKNVAINWDGLNIDTLISVGSTKSSILHIQSIGRVFRSDKPTIIDFVDNNQISKNHWRERKKNYDNMNCEMKEFHVNKEDKQKDIENMQLDIITKYKNKYLI